MKHPKPLVNHGITPFSSNMKIQFYDRQTGNIIDQDNLFVLNDQVWESNDNVYGNDNVSFEDFIDQRPDIQWRVIFLDELDTTLQCGSIQI